MGLVCQDELDRLLYSTRLPNCLDSDPNLCDGGVDGLASSFKDQWLSSVNSSELCLDALELVWVR